MQQMCGMSDGSGCKGVCNEFRRQISREQSLQRDKKNYRGDTSVAGRQQESMLEMRDGGVMLFVTYLMWESMYDEAVIGSGLEGRYGDSYMVCQDRSRDISDHHGCDRF